MENQDIFAAEADVDAEIRSGANSPRSHGEGVRARKTGERVTERYSDHEELPLLSDGRRSSSSGSSSRRHDHAGPAWAGMADFEGLPWWRKPSIFWLLPPFLLFTMAFGGIIVPKLDLILTLICRDYMAERAVEDPNLTIMPVIFGQDNPQCRIPEVQSRVAQFTLFGSLFSGILSAIISPKMGALSDRYGRIKLLVCTTSGMLLGELLTIFAVKYPETVSVNWILAGYAMDGLCGSFTCGMALAHSYATDCTSPQKRNVAFGYFHACLFTGIAIGPIVAGSIVEATGSVLSVFYIALGCHLFFIFFLSVCIPESLSKSRQLAAREKHRIEKERLGPAADWINQIRSFNILEPLKILYPTGPGSSAAVRRNLIFLASVDTIVFSVAMGSLTVVVIYTKLQFGWDTYESSKFVSIINCCRVLCLMVALPIVTRLVRGPNHAAQQRSSGSDNFDLSVIRLAVFFDVLGFLGYTFARSPQLFTLAGAVASVGGIGSPTLGSALTKHVPADRTGQLLGATGLLHAIARIVGPTIFNGIYSATVAHYRQTVFVCLAATFGLAFFCSWFVRPNVYLEDPDDSDRTPEASYTDEEDA